MQMQIFRAMALYLVIGLTGLAYAANERAIDIVQFESNKALYDFHEQVSLEALVANRSTASQSLAAEVVIKHGVDEMVMLDQKQFEIPAGTEQQITFQWDAGTSEYGHAAFLILKNTSGATIATSKPTIFEVCHDWRKIIRQGSFPVYHGYFDPNSPHSSEKSLAEKVRLFRDWGYNTVEFFGPYQARIDDPTPEADVWSFCFRDAPGTRQHIKDTKISKAILKQWIRGYHDAGMKVISYIHTPTYTIQDESWQVYDPASKKPMHYGGDSQTKRRWIEENGLGFPNSLAFSEDYGRKLADAVREYDWDGCFFDGFNQITDGTFSGVDKDGKPFTFMTLEELHAEGLRLLTTPARQVKDNFLAVPNGLHHLMGGIELFPARDMFGEDGSDFPWRKSAEHRNVFFGEWRAPLHRANSPWQLGRSLRAVREATGAPVFSIFTIASPEPWATSDSGIHGENTIYTYTIETVKPYTAVVLSNGIGYWEYYSAAPWGDLENDPVAIARVSYLKFAARYGQYLYDLDIHWTPRGMVEVDAPDHVYWKGNTFERKFASHREVYVHMINFDKMYLAAKLWDKTRTVPPRVSDIPIEIALAPGETEVAAFYVSADGDQEPKSVAAKIVDGKVKIVAPDLEYWSFVVVHIGKTQ